MSQSIHDLSENDNLPPFEVGPISRTTLSLYCGASGDHNPIHVDSDFARAAGFDDVFAHGMLSMAYLARGAATWVPQAALRNFRVRFTSITHVHDRVICEGRVVEKYEETGEKRLRIAVSARTDKGQTLHGEIIVGETASRRSI